MFSRLARLLLTFGTLLFALPAQAWDTPKYPVIFIPGLNSNAHDTWKDFVLKAWSNGWTYGGTFSHTGFLPSTMGIITFSKPLTYPKLDLNYSYSLTVHRADFYTLTFSSNQDLTFSQQGAELADVISAVKAANVAADPTRNKVILVGHSMGGLAARAYLQSSVGRANDDVDALITVGTPHLGTRGAKACIEAPTVCGLANGLRADSEAVTELAPDSDAFNNPNVGLNTTITLPGGVNTYVSIVVNGKSTPPNNGLFGDGDGIVPAASQNFDNVAGFKALAKNHLPELITLYDWSPGCNPLSSKGLTLAEFHTCETENPSVQDAIQRWIAISGITITAGSPPIVTTDSAFVTAGSTPQVIVQGSVAHPGPVTNTHVMFSTTLLTSFNVAQQQTSVPATLVEKSSLGLKSPQIAQQTSTPAVSVQEFSAILPGPLVPGQTYYYQFVADADGYTSYGQVHEVTIPPTAGIGALLPAPTGMLPATGAINQTLTPTLNWNPVANATSYRFMLAQNSDALPTDPTDGNCDRCLVDTVVPTAQGITYTPTAGILNPGTTYYWQVHARSPDNFGAWRSVDNSGAWIDASNFTTAMPTPAILLPVPTPITPDGATGLNTTPTLSWTPDSGAASYRIMIATNPAALTTDPTSADCAACVVNAIVSGGSSTTYVPDLGVLAPGTTYYWSIKARSENYYGAWSPVRSFSTGALAPIGTVTEFSAGISTGAGLGTITAGPDGNLWFTEQAGRIGRITPAGVVTEFSAGITAGLNFGPITAGPDGNLWFTQFSSNLSQIGRITPTGVVTEFSAGIFPGANLEGITAGPDGNLWFTENVGRIGRITPAGVVTEFSAGITSSALPSDITAGPDGNLWFTEYMGNGIGRITPTGVVTEFRAGITSGAMPSRITAGPDGNLWFTERFGDRIGRITPVGVVTEFSVGGDPGTYYPGITAGPDGNLWFTEFIPSRIGRITPTGVVTEFSAGISAGAGPSDITAGPDGNLWFTEALGNRIGRITSGVGTTSYALNVSSVNGTVTSAPSGINCGAICSAGFALGTHVTLTATPNAGSNFNGWSGAGCSGTGACQVTMNGATTVNATFSAITTPDAPIINGITLGDGSATITFIAPTNNGGSSITAYTATCTATGQATQTSTGTGSPLTVLGLTGGVAYSCAIAASNTIGTGTVSTALILSTQTPLTPTIGIATAGNAQASVSFTAPGSNGGSAITGYNATCTASGKPTGYGARSASPIIVTGLASGTMYSCTVTASNAMGTSAVSAAAFVTPTDIAAATTILEMPWFTKVPGYISRFVLVNTGASAASFNVTILNEAGNILSIDPAYASGSIAANSQFVINVDNLMLSLSAGQRAAAVITSSAPIGTLSGIYNLVQPSTGSISNVSLLRSQDFAGSASLLVAPWFNQQSDYSGIFIFTNAGNTDALAQASFLAPAGSSITPLQSSFTIPAQGQVIVNSASLASIAGGTQAAALFSINAPEGRVKGTYKIVNTTHGTAGSTELVNPQTASGSTTRLVAPWFSTAAGYSSSFILTNRGSSAAAYTITVQTETGNTATTGTLSGTIPANGQVILPASGIVTSFSGATRATAIFDVTGSPANIEGLYQIISQGTGAISNTILARADASGSTTTTLKLPWFSGASGYISRFVLVNRGASPAAFAIQILPEIGNTVTQIATSGTIPAQGQLVLPVTDVVSGFTGATRAAAVFTVFAPAVDIDGLYNIVNPTSGTISNTLMLK